MRDGLPAPRRPFILLAIMSRTLTAVNAKPIAAIMTRTVSASGMDWGVLAAAGVLKVESAAA